MKKTSSKERGLLEQRADAAEPLEVSCPCPLCRGKGDFQTNTERLQLQAELWCLHSRSLGWACTARLGHFLTLKYLIFQSFGFVQLFGLCDYAPLQKRMSALQICCGEVDAYGKSLSSNTTA